MSAWVRNRTGKGDKDGLGGGGGGRGREREGRGRGTDDCESDEGETAKLMKSLNRGKCEIDGKDKYTLALALPPVPHDTVLILNEKMNE